MEIYIPKHQFNGKKYVNKRLINTIEDLYTESFSGIIGEGGCKKSLEEFNWASNVFAVEDEELIGFMSFDHFKNDKPQIVTFGATPSKRI